MAKTYLFVDGTNLYAAQYELFGPNEYLDFGLFIIEIELKLNIKFSKIYFYASYTPRHSKNRKYLVNEFKFYKVVKNTKNVIFFKGYRSKSSGKEKEVDVKLSVDLVGYGLLNHYTQAFLMSGDADFLQAAFFIKRFHTTKKIKLLCISNKIMYKGLYALSSIIIDFTNKTIIKNKKIIDRNKFIYLDYKKLVFAL